MFVIDQAKSVHKVIAGPTGTLGRLAAYCARLERLSALVAERLPEPLKQHCRVANINDGSLVLYSTGPGWTTRMRFYAPELLQELRRQPGLSGLREICVRQAPPPEPPPSSRPTHMRHLSPAAAAHLEAAATALTTAPALQAALRRLAAHGSGCAS